MLTSDEFQKHKSVIDASSILRGHKTEDVDKIRNTMMKKLALCRFCDVYLGVSMIGPGENAASRKAALSIMRNCFIHDGNFKF